MLQGVLDLLRYPPKIQKMVLGLGDTSNNPEIIEMCCVGSPISKLKSYKTKLSRNYITELLNILPIRPACG